MKIFYTASFYGKSEYQIFYTLVLKAIKKTGVEVVSTEEGTYMRVISWKQLRKNFKQKEKHYLAIRKGIEEADAVIIEISKEDFQLGHEATLAIMNKKHVLCLSVHEDFSNKIYNKYFHGAQYSPDTVDSIVSAFIAKAKRMKYSERFNLMLSPKQVHYLAKKANEKGVSMSEVVRQVVEEKMNEGGGRPS